MPHPILPPTESQTAPYNEGQIVDPQTLKFRRAIKDTAQAHSICKRLIEFNKGRIDKSAAVMRKYNDEQPWNASKLKAAGQSWRSNRSTGFMSSMVKRVIPPYKQLLDSSKFLTASKLKGTDDRSQGLSTVFQDCITRCIRQWKDWNGFSYQIILENVLMGHGACGWTDPYDWKPKFWRDDEAIFPDGCPQEGKNVPLWTLKDNFLIHELADKLVDHQASSDVGWNINNLVKAINQAQPEDRKKGDTENLRKFEDTVRETSIGRSYSEGVKVVEAYHLFVQEANGKVSHYVMEAKTGMELFVRLDRFDSMDQCLGLLTIEIGNGKLYGSKGLGRVLYNTHVAADRARNNISDALYLSGLILLKATQKGKQAAAISVAHPVAIMGENYEVVDVKFEVNVEAFFALDRHFVSIAEMQVGAFMPGQILDSSGEKRTASEINYTASIEQQIREGVLARFWGQFLLIVGEMQRRICSEENIEQALQKYTAMTQSGIVTYTKKMIGFLKRIGRQIVGAQIAVEQECDYPEAVDCIIEMFQKGLKAEEIFELANTPANTYTQDMTQQNAQAIAAAYAKYVNNPRIRQTDLLHMDAAASLGNEKADQLVIPEEDNTLLAEATRLQIFEFDAMLGGDDIMVSPRDLDEIHMDVLEQKSEGLLPTLTPQTVTPETLDIVKRMVNHYGVHLQGATAKGASKEVLKPRIEFLKKAQMLLTQAEIAVGSAVQNTGVEIPEGAVPAGDVAIDAGAPVAPGANPMPTVTGAQPIPPNQPGGMPLARGPQNMSVTPS